MKTRSEVFQFEKELKWEHPAPGIRANTGLFVSGRTEGVPFRYLAVRHEGGHAGAGQSHAHGHRHPLQR